MRGNLRARAAGRRLTDLLLIGLLSLGGCSGVGQSDPEGEPRTTSSAPDALTEGVDEAGEAPGDGIEGDTDGAVAEAVELHQRGPVPEEPAAPAPSRAGDCPKRSARDRDVGILVAPRLRVKDHEVRVLTATLDSEEALALKIIGPDGKVVKLDATHRRGVPASTLGRFEPELAGDYRVVVGRGGKGLGCEKFTVVEAGGRRQPPAMQTAEVWRVSRAWNASEEALYSAWIRELFHAPRGESLAYERLDEITRDPKRNLMLDYLRWGEDGSKGLNLKPDCADTPYFLRAYWAWKRSLPFAWRTCSRGRDKPPKCFDMKTNARPPELAPTWALPDGTGEGTEEADQLDVMDRFFRRTVAWGVHTGNGRTAHGDDVSDFYPVRLDRRGLRPGAVYADPYGHILMVVELFDQAGDHPGILYAIDGQPDGSITRKRFWEGNFLWNPDPELGGSGFKQFRPVVLVKQEEETGKQVFTTLGDESIQKRSDYGDVDPKPGSMTADEFYDRMTSLLNADPLDPFLAQEDAVRALSEQTAVRVTSVNNGVEYHAEHPDDVIDMPAGYAIFETTGAWESYSTPARDLRLLIAMDVVARFDAKVARQPAAYGLEADDVDAIRKKLGAARKRLLADPKLGISYTRSDGSTWKLTLAELFERREALERAYNPNDCPEVRWGAPAGSAELKTCDRRAPEDQRAKMDVYRVWFKQRRRPPRGDPGPPIPGYEDENTP